MRRGLDADGFIAREGSLDRVPAPFRDLVAASRDAVTEAFGERLHSAYLYGSVPRGTAVPGRSDLDVSLALHAAPDDADRSAADRIERELGARHPVAVHVDLALFPVDAALSAAERFDLAWTVACLATPLAGEDLASRLPRYRPSSDLARETNGDLALHVPRWRRRLAAGEDVTRSVTRKTVRTGLMLVMTRWNGWTSDLTESAAVFGEYYPDRAAAMSEVAAAAVTGTAPAGFAEHVLDDLVPWLAAEYTRVHGDRTPRANPLR